MWGHVTFPSLSSPSGRRLCRNPETNPRQAEGLHISDEGHGTGQPWGQECSNVPAFLHRTALLLCWPKHGSRIRSAHLRLPHVELADNKINNI